MKLTPGIIENSRRAYLTLEELVFLYSSFTQAQETWRVELDKVSIQKLTSLGYLYQESLTPSGSALILSILGEEVPLASKGGYSPEFETFWKEFPSTDAHGNFPPTRNIRSGKRDAYREWLALIGEGFDAEVIINGLQAEVISRKETSTYKGGNNLKFIKSPINYLKSKAFMDNELETEPITYGSTNAGFA